MPRYEIDVLQDPELDEDEVDEILNDEDGTCYGISLLELSWERDIEWEENEEDMIAISERMPDAVFVVTCYGGTPDAWRKYFRNGEMQFCPGIITFEELDI